MGKQPNIENPQTKAAARPCPICGKPAVEAARPFCSKRCADVDLHRWLTGTYAIPLPPGSDEDEKTIDDV
jgi:endogenous inhibitor of DNA gyrase (YacG/DUF329 family)